MPKYSVKKPMTVFVVIVIIIALGVVSLLGMTPDLMPSIDLPYVVVMTTYPGATPQEVETSVTKPLEQGLATVALPDPEQWDRGCQSHRLGWGHNDPTSGLKLHIRIRFLLLLLDIYSSS